MSTTGDVKRLALGFREDAIYIEIDDRQTGTERRRINRLKSSYEVNFKVLGDKYELCRRTVHINRARY